MDLKSYLTNRINSVGASTTLAIEAKAKTMKAQGLDVVSFGAGEPDFDTPDFIKKAAKDALDKGQTKYAPVAGNPDLREAICQKLKKDNGLEYKPENVVVSFGAKHSLYNVTMVLCQEGDEVIVPGPYWVSYPEFVRLASAKPVFVCATEETGFKITPEMLEKAVTEKTKALYINSPSNPTGAVYTKKELQAIAEIALKHKFFVISDEIYEKLIYGNVEHYSIATFSPEMKQLTVTINGFSKSHAMTGWRLGYLAAEKEIASAVSNLQSHSTSGPVTFAMVGATAGLKADESFIQMMKAEFQKRRDYMAKRLNSIKGITCPTPDGAFYCFPNISQLGLDSMKFSTKLLDEKMVAVIPGGAFGADGNIRLSYACSMQNIEKGLDRIEEFVKAL